MNQRVLRRDAELELECYVRILGRYKELSLTLCAAGSRFSTCIPSHPRFFPDLLECMEHSALISVGDSKNSRDFRTG